MDKIFLNLVWLYPDILNLHGERGSIQAFQKVAENLNVEIKITRVNDYKEKIDFKNTDIIFCPPGELKVMPNIIAALESQKDEFEKYIEDNKYLLCIGTTGSIFAKNIKKENGEVIEGLGLIDMDVAERKMVLGDDLQFVINKTKQEIIGSQIQLVDFNVKNEDSLGNVEYGYGNNGTELEGARKKNAIFTNCLGPVFVKNPWWAEEIIKDAILNKEYNISTSKEYVLENKSFNTTKKFIKEKPKGDENN